MEQGNVRALGVPATADDLELFTRIEQTLYTAVVCDALDEMGYRDQAMREWMRPVCAGYPFAGWARTVLCADVYHVCEEPYALEIEAVDSILTGEVVVVATGGSIQNAPWGELLSIASRARGARGAVIDGLVRDVRKIETIGFPLFARGIKPVDSRGRGIVMDYNVPVECAGVKVTPGDLIFADYDGVVAIPKEAVWDAVERASNKVTRENHTRRELADGAYLKDVYARYGVL